MQQSTKPKLFPKRKETLQFFKMWVKNPSSVGAILPSSDFLAQEMAAQVQQKSNGLVVELGGGTGVVTSALLKKGIKPEDLIVIEYSPLFVANLKSRFPHLRVYEGNAMHLSELLKNESRPIDSIVSSLPLLSFPKTISEKILQEIMKSLAPHGQYIQYTYSLTENHFTTLTHHKKIFSKRIWRNIPPARVDVWTKG